MHTNFVLTGTSPAAAGTVVGPVSDGVTQCIADYTSMRVEASLQGATGGALDVYLQVSYDQGVSWTDFAHFSQLAAGAAAIKYAFTSSRNVGDGAIVTPGKDTSPTLAANTVRAGDWGSMIRVLFVAGVGTSAGAAQSIKFYLD